LKITVKYYSAKMPTQLELLTQAAYYIENNPQQQTDNRQQQQLNTTSLPAVSEQPKKVPRSQFQNPSFETNQKQVVDATSSNLASNSREPVQLVHKDEQNMTKTGLKESNSKEALNLQSNQLTTQNSTNVMMSNKHHPPKPIVTSQQPGLGQQQQLPWSHLLPPQTQPQQPVTSFPDNQAYNQFVMSLLSQQQQQSPQNQGNFPTQGQVPRAATTQPSTQQPTIFPAQHLLNPANVNPLLLSSLLTNQSANPTTSVHQNGTKQLDQQVQQHAANLLPSSQPAANPFNLPGFNGLNSNPMALYNYLLLNQLKSQQSSPYLPQLPTPAPPGLPQSTDKVNPKAPALDPALLAKIYSGNPFLNPYLGLQGLPMPPQSVSPSVNNGQLHHKKTPPSADRQQRVYTPATKAKSNEHPLKNRLKTYSPHAPPSSSMQQDMKNYKNMFTALDDKMNRHYGKQQPPPAYNLARHGNNPAGNSRNGSVAPQDGNYKNNANMAMHNSTSYQPKRSRVPSSNLVNADPLTKRHKMDTSGLVNVKTTNPNNDSVYLFSKFKLNKPNGKTQMPKQNFNAQQSKADFHKQPWMHNYSNINQYKTDLAMPKKQQQMHFNGFQNDHLANGLKKPMQTSKVNNYPTTSKSNVLNDVESHFKRSLGADQYKQIMNNDTKKHEEKKHPQKQKNFHYYQESGGAIVKIDKSADVDFLFKRELGGKAWENLTENTDPKQLNSEHHHKYTNERLAKTGKLPLERLQERQKQLANKKVQSIEVDSNNNKNGDANQKPVNLETKDEEHNAVETQTSKKEVVEEMEQTQPLDFSKKPARRISQEKMLRLQDVAETPASSTAVASVNNQVNVPTSLNLKKNNFYDDDIKEFSSPSDSDDWKSFKFH